MPGVITPIVQAGTDAFSNLYDVEFTLPTLVTSGFNDNSGTKPTLTYSIRIDGFTPPAATQSTYKVDYKGISIERLGSAISFERRLTFAYRIDANYSMYEDFKKWQHIYMDPSGEGNINFDAIPFNALTDTDVNAKYFGKVKVYAYGGLNLSAIDVITGAVAQATWQYFDVICLDAGSPPYTRKGAEPVSATASFMFIRTSVPGSSVATPADGPTNLTGQQ